MSLCIEHFYRFGDFTLDVDQRILLRKGRPRPLAPKVFDTLVILVEKKGRIVAKDELMRRLWPDTFVEEANLTFNVQQLRKALGDNARKPIYIETVTRRGYRFISTVEEIPNDSAENQTTDRSRIADSGGAAGALEIKQTREIDPAATQEASTATHDTELKKPKKRNLLLTAVVLIILAGSGIVVSRFSKRPAGNELRADSSTSLTILPRIEKLTATGQSRMVAMSPDGRYIAYTRHIENKTSIWLRELATNNNVEIVPAKGGIYGLAFGHNGQHLFFARRGEPISEPLLYQTALYRISLVGGVPTKIVDTLEGKFSISEDDKQIAFIRQAINRDGERESALMVVNSDGSGERRLLMGTHPDDLESPLWSPSGESIICACGSSDGGGQRVSLIQVKLADGTKTELTADKFFHISRMAWLPDKRAILMSATKNLGFLGQLWRVSFPGMEMTQITNDPGDYLDLSIASNADSAVATQSTRVSDIWLGPATEPERLKKITQGISDFCWTPSGRVIYSSTATGNIDLWIMQPEGTEQRQLTVKSGVNLRPAVALDGRYLVFISNRTGTFQVWRMNLDGTNQTQLTDGAAKEYSAVSPDGKWVLYNTADDWHLWKASIDGGEPVQLTPYVALRPSVSPDGKMIACVGRNETGRKLLILSFETGQLLREFQFVGWSSRLQWTPDSKGLFYAAQNDGIGTILEQSLDGEVPTPIAEIGEDELFDFGYSFEGQLLAVIRGGWQHDIVLISDFNRAGDSPEISPIARQ